MDASIDLGVGPRPIRVPTGHAMPIQCIGDRCVDVSKQVRVAYFDFTGTPLNVEQRSKQGLL